MTSIVKWLANGRLTIEAMSPKLVVSSLNCIPEVSDTRNSVN